ncbi:MAG: hypothetical protein JOZ99_07415 [Actinobacteria bacterium]|nr:hypothetical protein [Actinomycetota bacterium]
MPSTVSIISWPDPVIDTLGFDPRSLYVETFWLPTLGPTSVLLLRHLAARLDVEPDGFDLFVSETSQALGLGAREGNSSPLIRSLARLGQFDLACDDGRGTLAVRRHVPPVNRRHVRRLPDALQAAHTEWVQAQLAEPPVERARRRARRLALLLLEQGDDIDRVEHALRSAGFQPTVAHESASWAVVKHREALAAVEQETRTVPAA